MISGDICQRPFLPFPRYFPILFSCLFLFFLWRPGRFLGLSRMGLVLIPNLALLLIKLSYINLIFVCNMRHITNFTINLLFLITTTCNSSKYSFIYRNKNTVFSTVRTFSIYYLCLYINLVECCHVSFFSYRLSYFLSQVDDNVYLLKSLQLDSFFDSLFC